MEFFHSPEGATLHTGSVQLKNFIIEGGWHKGLKTYTIRLLSLIKTYCATEGMFLYIVESPITGQCTIYRTIDFLML